MMQLSYAQNATTASTNADDLQEVLYGNVTLNDFLTIVDDLEVNASGGTIGRSFVFSINDEVAGNPGTHAIGFIGSIATGHKVAERAAR